MKTAASQILLMNKRRIRAEQLAAAIIEELERVIDTEKRKDVYTCLLDIFYRNGLYLIDDHDRELLGLEKRDDIGWTSSELIKYKRSVEESILYRAGVIPKRFS